MRLLFSYDYLLFCSFQVNYLFISPAIFPFDCVPFSYRLQAFKCILDITVSSALYVRNFSATLELIFFTLF